MGLTPNYYAWKKLTSKYCPEIDRDDIVSADDSGLVYDSGTTDYNASKTSFGYAYDGLNASDYLNIHKAHFNNFSFSKDLTLYLNQSTISAAWWTFSATSELSRGSITVLQSSTDSKTEYLITETITNTGSSTINNLKYLYLLKRISWERNGDDTRGCIFWKETLDTPITLGPGQSVTIAIRWTEGE